MVAPHLIIEPNAVYDDALLCSALDVGANVLTERL
jgi:hypothetical protein